MTNSIKKVGETVFCIKPSMKKIKCGMSPEIQFDNKKQIKTNLSSELKDDIAFTLGVTKEKLNNILVGDLDLPLAA